MELTLFYRGEVLSSGNTKGEGLSKRRHKHALRKAFANQLERVRGNPLPLFDFGKLVEKGDKKIKYWARVTRANSSLAEVDIFMLRPEPPGSIVQQGGDIDNRLKTILDALRIPTFEELPPEEVDAMAQPGKTFCCVLEDDSLITAVSVRTDRLLDVDPGSNPHEAVVLIKVRIDDSRSPKWMKHQG